MRCFGNLLHHKPAIHPDRWRVIANLTARLLENLTGALMQKIDANLFEDLHGGIVDPLDTLCIQGFCWGVDILRLTPGRLGKPFRRGPLFARSFAPPCPVLPVRR